MTWYRRAGINSLCCASRFPMTSCIVPFARVSRARWQTQMGPHSRTRRHSRGLNSAFSRHPDCGAGHSGETTSVPLLRPRVGERRMNHIMTAQPTLRRTIAHSVLMGLSCLWSVHIAAASLLPCHGVSARIFSTLGMFAIGLLFFLQGARLSRTAITAGMTNWRLHLGIAACTFMLFPLLGSALVALFPHAMGHQLWLGVLFVCALPSTVQSSIALVSIAQGNIAGAVCAATGSNVIGFVLTPILLAVTAHLQGRRRRGRHLEDPVGTSRTLCRRSSVAALDRPMGGAQPARCWQSPTGVRSCWSSTPPSARALRTAYGISYRHSRSRRLCLWRPCCSRWCW